MINMDTFRKEILQLFDIGVLTLIQKSKYGTPIFVIPRKYGTLRFIMDYCNLKQKIVKNPYPLPIIDNAMH